MVDMVCERSLFSDHFCEVERFFVIFREDVKCIRNFHLFIVECDRVLLNSKPITLSMLIHFLVDSELFDFTFFFNNVVRDNIATCTFNPSVSPARKIFFETMLFGGVADVTDKVLKLRVLVSELFKVRSDSSFEHFSSEPVESLL